MTQLGIIGGTGLTRLTGLNDIREKRVETPFGEPSSPLIYGELEGREVVFLPRHGKAHSLPPHKVNYRANIHALHQAGVSHVVAIVAVGGIGDDMRPGVIAIPDQIIDYTWGRKQTFFEDDAGPVTHIDFTHPYCEALRNNLLEVARKRGIQACDGGVYGATQGPRLETAAEIRRMKRDGCTLVGMTAMPEAALARELGLCYANCALVVNLAAGLGKGEITMEDIQATMADGMEEIRKILSGWAGAV